MKPYRITILLAIFLFVLDSFVMNQGFLSVLVILFALFILVPRAFLAYRKNRQLYLTRLNKVGIFLLAAFAVFPVNALQNRIADRRAIKIGNACLAFRAKYHRYPETLTELVPEFIPSVPLAKPLAGIGFFYSSHSSGGEPMFFYEALPPFGRRFYHMEKGYWGYLD
jgi:hypothetical protein